MFQNYHADVDSERNISVALEPRFSSLTCREREILFELLKVSHVKLVAKNLDISRFTVNQHLRSIYAKLGVNTKLDAVMYFLSHAHRQTKNNICKSSDEIHCKARQVTGCEVMLCHLASFCLTTYCMLEQCASEEDSTSGLNLAKRWMAL